MVVYVHFPHLCPERGLILDPDCPQCSDLPPTQSNQSSDALQILTQEINVLSNKVLALSDPSTPSRAILDAFQSAKYSLEMAVTSMQGTSALLDKDNIAPNHRSWLEMAEWMGTK